MERWRALRRVHSLVVAEVSSGAATPGSVAALRCALSMGKVGRQSAHVAQTDLLLAGPVSEERRAAYRGVVGLSELMHCSDPAASDYFGGGVQSLARALCSERTYSHVFAPSSSFGRLVLPSLYTPGRTALLTDVLSFPTPTSAMRLSHTGALRLQMELPAPPVTLLCTVRAQGPVPPLEESSPSYSSSIVSGSPPNARCPERSLSLSVSSTAPWSVRATFRSANAKADLSSSSIVVSGGRALGSPEEFQRLVHGLASALHAAVGATRLAVDLGFSPAHTQVGQTGTTVSPPLYIAVGLSGSSQHLVGMRDSGTIVAINKDGQAPIWSVAHLGIEGDLFQAVPALIERLRRASP